MTYKPFFFTLTFLFAGVNTQAQSYTSVFSKTIYLSKDKSTVFPNTSHYCYYSCDTFENQLRLSEEDFPALTGIAVKSIIGNSIKPSDLMFALNGFLHRSDVNYWYIIPGNAGNTSSIWNHDYTKTTLVWDAFHNLVQNPATRASLTQNAISAIVKLCSLFPQDFTDRVVSEARQLISICPEIKTVNLNAFDSENYSFWVGFLVRRHFTDGVPVSEMETALKTLIAKLQSPNSPQKPSTFYSYSVNNSIAIDWKQSQLQIRKPGSTSIKSLSFGITELKKITCLKDSTGTYYLLEFFEWYGGQWVEKKTLFSDKLEVVY